MRSQTPIPPPSFVGFGGLDGKTLEPNTSQPWLETIETGKCGVISSSLLESSQSTQTSGVHIPLIVRPITLQPRALVLNHSVVQIFWIIGNIYIIDLQLGCRKCILMFFFNTFGWKEVWTFPPISHVIYLFHFMMKYELDRLVTKLSNKTSEFKFPVKSLHLWYCGLSDGNVRVTQNIIRQICTETPNESCQLYCWG